MKLPGLSLNFRSRDEQTILESEGLSENHIEEEEMKLKSSNVFPKHLNLASKIENMAPKHCGSWQGDKIVVSRTSCKSPENLQGIS